MISSCGVGIVELGPITPDKAVRQGNFLKSILILQMGETSDFISNVVLEC